MIVQKLQTIFKIFLISLFLFSCGHEPVEFRPTIWATDYVNGDIVQSGTGNRLSCYEKKIQEYACMSLNDIVTLASILRNAKVPKKLKKELDNFLKSSLNVSEIK